MVTSSNAMPVRLTKPGPSRSVRAPAMGNTRAYPRPRVSRSRPVVVASKPALVWKYSGSNRSSA